jgi:hypothetical protein
MLAHRQSDKQASTLEKIKIKIAKLGVRQKARATITTRDGAKIKGFVSSAGDEDFVMRADFSQPRFMTFVLRDRKTASPTTIL